MDPNRTGVLLIRAWLEEEPPQLRVRITQAGPQRTVGFGTTPDEVAGKVRDWLERFRSDPAGPDD
jgi:hypothetical protein